MCSTFLPGRLSSTHAEEAEQLVALGSRGYFEAVFAPGLGPFPPVDNPFCPKYATCSNFIEPIDSTKSTATTFRARLIFIRHQGWGKIAGLSRDGYR